MIKLLRGILDYRRNVFPAYRQTFARLAHGQHPDCLFFACSDSRVVPNLVSSTQPGDLFAVRNVGNMVPPHPSDVESSPAAAIEFSLLALGVRDIVVCGHSSCGAMKALLQPPGEEATHLRRWLEAGRPRGELLDAPWARDSQLPPYDVLSQANVLAQLEHLRTYPVVAEREARGEVRLHGWWFEVATGEVHHWDPERGQFAVVDEEVAETLIERFEPTPAQPRA